MSTLVSALLRAPEGRTERELRDDYRAAFPRATAAFGRGFSVDSLRIDARRARDDERRARRRLPSGADEAGVSRRSPAISTSISARRSITSRSPTAAGGAASTSSAATGRSRFAIACSRGS